MPAGVPVRLTPEKEQWIKDQILAGISQVSIANTLGLSTGWVHLYVKRLGESDPDIADTMRDITDGTEVRLQRIKELRTKLLEQAVKKIEEILPTLNTASQMQSISIALGILIDKSRLEEGSSTSKTEVSTDNARESIASRIAELTKRRGTTDNPLRAVS